jgi:hypothetical protein
LGVESVWMRSREPVRIVGWSVGAAHLSCVMLAAEVLVRQQGKAKPYGA